MRIARTRSEHTSIAAQCNGSKQRQGRHLQLASRALLSSTSGRPTVIHQHPCAVSVGIRYPCLNFLAPLGALAATDSSNGPGQQLHLHRGRLVHLDKVVDPRSRCKSRLPLLVVAEEHTPFHPRVSLRSARGVSCGGKRAGRHPRRPPRPGICPEHNLGDRCEETRVN